MILMMTRNLDPSQPKPKGQSIKLPVVKSNRQTRMSPAPRDYTRSPLPKGATIRSPYFSKLPAPRGIIRERLKSSPVNELPAIHIEASSKARCQEKFSKRGQVVPLLPLMPSIERGRESTSSPILGTRTKPPGIEVTKKPVLLAKSVTKAKVCGKGRKLLDKLSQDSSIHSPDVFVTIPRSQLKPLNTFEPLPEISPNTAKPSSQHVLPAIGPNERPPSVSKSSSVRRSDWPRGTEISNRDQLPSPKSKGSASPDSTPLERQSELSVEESGVNLCRSVVDEELDPHPYRLEFSLAPSESYVYEYADNTTIPTPESTKSPSLELCVQSKDVDLHESSSAVTSLWRGSPLSPPAVNSMEIISSTPLLDERRCHSSVSIHALSNDDVEQSPSPVSVSDPHPDGVEETIGDPTSRITNGESSVASTVDLLELTKEIDIKSSTCLAGVSEEEKESYNAPYYPTSEMELPDAPVPTPALCDIPPSVEPAQSSINDSGCSEGAKCSDNLRPLESCSTETVVSPLSCVIRKASCPTQDKEIEEDNINLHSIGHSDVKKRVNGRRERSVTFSQPTSPQLPTNDDDEVQKSLASSGNFPDVIPQHHVTSYNRHIVDKPSKTSSTESCQDESPVVKAWFRAPFLKTPMPRYLYEVSETLTTKSDFDEDSWGGPLFEERVDKPDVVLGMLREGDITIHEYYACAYLPYRTLLETYPTSYEPAFEHVHRQVFAKMAKGWKFKMNRFPLMSPLRGNPFAGAYTCIDRTEVYDKVTKPNKYGYRILFPSQYQQ